MSNLSTQCGTQNHDPSIKSHMLYWLRTPGAPRAMSLGESYASVCIFKKIHKGYLFKKNEKVIIIKNKKNNYSYYALDNLSIKIIPWASTMNSFYKFRVLFKMRMTLFCVWGLGCWVAGMIWPLLTGEASRAVLTYPRSPRISGLGLVQVRYISC